MAFTGGSTMIDIRSDLGVALAARA